MGKKDLIHKIVATGIVFLFIIASVTPMVIGYRQEANERDILLEQLKFMCATTNGDDGMYEYYKDELLNNDYFEDDDKEIVEPIEAVVYEETYLPLDGPMDSPWPVKCHDLHHTGLSPYSTADNPYDELWKFETEGWMNSGIAIDNDGVLYFGSYDRYLYAVYPDGTLKWRYGRTGMWITSSPAIAEDGTVYVGSWDSKLYAVNPDGTEKWSIGMGGSVDASPAIAEDGTIYVGAMGPGDYGRINAVNPNGTIKWQYNTGYWITGGPAIADDGTIYIGSGDNYLYAMYPNGTLRWRFHTGHYVKGPPSIADDGTIYIGSWDDYLYALYPNGTMKWRHQVGLGTESNPSIGPDGTIYVGGGYLYAVNPNGTRKWTFDFGSNKRSHWSCPAISADGIIYISLIIGSDDGGEILAVNPDATERWRKWLADNEGQSSPSISSDGTIYVGSSTMASGNPHGNLHAFGEWDPTAPDAPAITGETQGQYGEEYEYTFVSTDPENQDVRYYIEWGDGETEEWIGPYSSGQEISVSHTWDEEDTYTIRAKAKDTLDVESQWGTLEVTMPVNQQYQYPLFHWFLERFPNAFPILRQLLGL